MALITRFAISFYKFMLYKAVLVFANCDILVNLLSQNGLFLYFLSCKLLKVFISAPSFTKIDGFENLPLKIDGFDRPIEPVLTHYITCYIWPKNCPYIGSRCIEPTLGKSLEVST